MNTVMSKELGDTYLRLVQNGKKFQIKTNIEKDMDNVYYINFDTAIIEFNNKMEQVNENV